MQVCFGTCHHVMHWRCQSSRMPWPFWPIVSSYPTLTGTPPQITMMTASSTSIHPRCCAMLQAVSGKQQALKILSQVLFSSSFIYHIIILFSSVRFCLYCTSSQQSPQGVCVYTSTDKWFFAEKSKFLNLHHCAIIGTTSNSICIFCSFLLLPFTFIHWSTFAPICVGHHRNNSSHAEILCVLTFILVHCASKLFLCTVWNHGGQLTAFMITVFMCISVWENRFLLYFSVYSLTPILVLVKPTLYALLCALLVSEQLL